ncbi:HAD family hydrolase, partial [bacterium]|nr:HAD family hydrolase [bacterium]
RHKTYRAWCQKTLIELNEKELWTQFMLRGYSPELISEKALELNHLWRESAGKRVNYPGAFETIRALAKRGYILGVISNTDSSTEVPDFLKQEGVADLFKTVILSAVFGKRKPHPSPFLRAASEVGVLPENCAYVGNWPSRDLVGPREAGFSEVVIFEPDYEEIERVTTPMRPDFTIHSLPELLDLYPDRHSIETKGVLPSSPRVQYDAALSTMWAVGQAAPFADTFRIAREIGFARFELNHKVSPKMLSEVDFNLYRIGNVHDPCPAEIPMEEQAAKDWLISSPNEENRQQGVRIVKHTIDTAVLLGARSVIVHAGGIAGDRSLDRHLRKLYEEGGRETSEFENVRQLIIADRKHKVGPYFQSVIKSVKEIIEYARNSGVEIGLENRYRYYDIPIVDELQPLLDICDEDWLGFQYDVGHAHT